MCQWTTDWTNLKRALLRKPISELGCSSFWLRLGRKKISKRNNSSHTCKSNGTKGLVLIIINRFRKAICLVCFTTMLFLTMLFLLLLGGIPLWLLLLLPLRALLLLILGVLLPRERMITSRNTWAMSSMSTGWSLGELRLNSWAHKIPSQLGKQGLGSEDKGGQVIPRLRDSR